MTFRTILGVFACSFLAGGMARSDVTYTKQQFMREYSPAYEKLSSHAGQIRGKAEITRSSTGRRGHEEDSLIVTYSVNGENKRIDFDAEEQRQHAGSPPRRTKHTTVSTGPAFFIAEQPDTKGRYRLAQAAGQGGDMQSDIQVCETISDMLFLVYSKTVMGLMNDAKTSIDEIREVSDSASRRVRVRFHRNDAAGPRRQISSGSFELIPEAGWVLASYQLKLKDGTEVRAKISHRVDGQGNYCPLRYEREGVFEKGYSSMIVDVREYEPHPFNPADYSLAQFGLEYLQRPAGDSGGVWHGSAIVSLVAIALAVVFWKMANRRVRLATG